MPLPVLGPQRDVILVDVGHGAGTPPPFFDGVDLPELPQPYAWHEFPIRLSLNWVTGTCDPPEPIDQILVNVPGCRAPPPIVYNCGRVPREEI